MYGKIFDSMYDGTLYGQWEAIVTFQQMIVLCDADGTVDMTPPAIAARTSIPLEIILKGLGILAEPDPYTRTPGCDGKRIELLDDHRPWGWTIVNHEKYKALQDADTVRAQTRERVKAHREKKRLVTVGNGEKRHTDTDTDTKNTTSPDGSFLSFWNAWPAHDRKASKGKCSDVWRKKKLGLLAEQIVAHVEALKTTDQWRNGYIPAPMVYLNKEMWDGAEIGAVSQGEIL